MGDLYAIIKCSCSAVISGPRCIYIDRKNPVKVAEDGCEACKAKKEPNGTWTDQATE